MIFKGATAKLVRFFDWWWGFFVRIKTALMKDSLSVYIHGVVKQEKMGLTFSSSYLLSKLSSYITSFFQISALLSIWKNWQKTTRYMHMYYLVLSENMCLNFFSWHILDMFFDWNLLQFIKSSVVIMISSCVDLSFNITFTLFLIIHVGLFGYIIYHIICVIKDFTEKTRIPENRIENIVIEPMSLKSETSGLY